MRRTKPSPRKTGTLDSAAAPSNEAPAFDVARFIRSERENRIRAIIRTVLKPLVNK